MNRKDSAKAFGLAGAALIVVAYAIWAFILPARSSNEQQDNKLEQLAAPTEQPQATPSRPISEPTMPSR
jgi:flagellar biosynthesis/type III secretory pathway M-ring protein FliF/YscJ